MCKRYISLSLDLDGRPEARRALAKKADARCGGIATRFAKKPATVTWSGLRVDWRYLVSCAALVAMMVAVLTSLVFQRSEHEYSGEGLPVSWGFLV